MNNAAVNVSVNGTNTPKAQYKTIILKPNYINKVNTLIQEMVSLENVKYVVKYNYVLGEDVTIPENCVLEFDGGSFTGEHTITCQDTIINGCANCIGSMVAFSGNYNSLDLAWLGVIGSNNNNTSILNSLNRFSKKDFYLSSDIVCNKGDIILPWDCHIDGQEHCIRFTCDEAENGLLCLSQSTYLENITIQSYSNVYNGVCILCDSQLSNMEIFNMNNVKIQGKYKADHHYITGCGLKIHANNDGNNFNCFTNCRLNHIQISFVNIGIEMICNNTYNENGRFAWMNQIYIDDLFIQADKIGIKTNFINNDIRPAVAVGPLYVSRYEMQSAHDAIYFRHEGSWKMYINTGYHYDAPFFLGQVIAGQIALNNIQNDGVRDEDGTDDDGDYTCLMGVRMYNKGKLFFNSIENASLCYFVDSKGYSSSTGEKRFILGSKDNAFTLSRPGFYKALKLYNNSRDDEIKIASKTANTTKHIIRMDSDRPCIEYELISDYPSSLNYKLASLRRFISSQGQGMYNPYIKIIGGGRNYELFRAIMFDANIEYGELFRIKIKMLFQNNGTQINYQEYQEVSNRLQPRQSFSKLKIAECEIKKAFYVADDNLNLYVVAKSLSPRTLTNLFIYFDALYDDTFEIGRDISVADNGEISVNRTNNDYLYGVEMSRMEYLGLYDKGVNNYDYTSNRNTYWNGEKWVDEKGFTPNINRGTIADAQALVSNNLITTDDAGYEFYATDLKKPIYYGGDSKWYDATGTEVTA